MSGHLALRGIGLSFWLSLLRYFNSKPLQFVAFVGFFTLAFEIAISLKMERGTNIHDLRIKGVSFLRNCGDASVGKYNRVIWYYQLS